MYSIAFESLNLATQLELFAVLSGAKRERTTAGNQHKKPAYLFHAHRSDEQR